MLFLFDHVMATSPPVILGSLLFVMGHIHQWVTALLWRNRSAVPCHSSWTTSLAVPCYSFGLTKLRVPCNSLWAGDPEPRPVWYSIWNT